MYIYLLMVRYTISYNAEGILGICSHVYFFLDFGWGALLWWFCDLSGCFSGCPVYGLVSNAGSHGHVIGLIGSAFNEGALLDTGLPMDLQQLHSALPLLHYISSLLQFTFILFPSHFWPLSICPCFPLVLLSCPCLSVSLIFVPKLPWSSHISNIITCCDNR